jgi:tetratricopeptide (TPR) repeat protein
MAGLLLIGLPAAGIVWTASRSKPAWGDRGIEAYRRKEWAEAGELARGWLKSHPDDVEALRLLARSTARLGRDGPANAVFARLGESALQAEDLYLLALGLSRAGQAESALRLWERGLAMDPGHAETLAQVALVYTTRNRLVEAAREYERLAGIPGWEMGGELSLGALRAELNDPARASRILRRALGRAEAGSLDALALTRYRKLLARCLLRVGKPGEARPELDRVLGAGRDPEASWLLSRVFLQEGDKAGAALAIAQSGSYRADHPLDLEPGPHVGEGRCVECHRELSRAYREGRSHKTLLRGEELLDLPYPDGPLPDPADPGVTHCFLKTDGKVSVETRVEDKILRAVVDYAFGSPDRYVSLVGHDEKGRSHILRLSHYRQGPNDAGWLRTTGHTADAEGGRDFLGKPMDEADGVLKCLFCHSTNPQSILSGSGPESNDRAIGCERCHGPGGNHLKAVEARLSDMAIVSPAQGSGEGSLRLCAQCHAFHQELDLPRTDFFWVRFQGTSLPWSRCYTESEGTLDCVTCHDPHRNAERSASYYEAKCLSCHSQALPKDATHGDGKTRSAATHAGSTCPIDASKGCLGCHMPALPSKAHRTTFTDHYIRIRPETKPGPAPAHASK